MEIETLKLTDVVADPKNVRAHPTRNLDAIKASLTKFGQQKPIVIDRKGIVVAGNGTVEAARALGWTEVRVVRTELEGAEAVAYAIADNRTGDLAEWDDPELAAVLTALQEDDAIDVAVTGFTSDEIVALLEKAYPPQVHEDELPAVQEKCITRLGDLWLLGEHRLLCGDSTKAEDVARVMNGEQGDSIVWDPPWDIPVKFPGTMPTALLVFADGKRLGDATEQFGSPTWLFVWDCSTSWYTPNRPLKRIKIALWYGDLTSYKFDGAHYGESLREIRVTNTRGTYNYHPDPRGKHLADLFVQPITQLHASRSHAHEKPLAWVRCLLANCTNGLIYDSFLGSGTTLIAAEQLGRRCYGIEIEPKYCDVICRRWSRLTGKEPVRESDGAEFSGCSKAGHVILSEREDGQD